MLISWQFLISCTTVSQYVFSLLQSTRNSNNTHFEIGGLRFIFERALQFWYITQVNMWRVL